jgi:hypothetical protein
MSPLWLNMPSWGAGRPRPQTRVSPRARVRGGYQPGYQPAASAPPWHFAVRTDGVDLIGGVD